MNGRQCDSTGRWTRVLRAWGRCAKVRRGGAFLLLATVAVLASASTAHAVIIFQEDFNGYASNPGFPGTSNDLGGHRTIYGVPTVAQGADSGLWMGARFEAYDSNPISSDVGVLRYGSGSSGGPYGNPAGRVSDDAGLVVRLDLTFYTDVELSFDWRTYATETTDRLVAAFYVGDGLGTPNNTYDWFNDPLYGNGDMSASDPNGQANTWYVNNWVEVLRATSPSGFQQETGISLPGGSVLYLAFWLDNGDNDLGKIDNIVVSANQIPEPSSVVLALIGGAIGVGAVLRRRFALRRKA